MSNFQDVHPLCPGTSEIQVRLDFIFSINSFILCDFSLTSFHLGEASIVPGAIFKNHSEKTSISYSEKIQYVSGWTEASLYNSSGLSFFICITWKYKQSMNNRQPHRPCKWKKSNNYSNNSNNNNKTKKCASPLKPKNCADFRINVLFIPLSCNKDCV